MINDELREVIEAVSNFNDEIIEIMNRPDVDFLLGVETDGVECNVKFLGNTIWSSVNDSKPYDEIKDEYPPFSSFLIDLVKNKLVELVELNTKLHGGKSEDSKA